MSADRRLSRMAVGLWRFKYFAAIHFFGGSLYVKKGHLNARNDVKLSGHTINAKPSIIPSELQDGCEQQRE